MKVILSLAAMTANRGTRAFIVAQNDKGYFAHEVGEETQWAKVTGNGERKAHKLNGTVKRRNQYGTFFKPKPFKTLDEATAAIATRAQQTVIYS